MSIWEIVLIGVALAMDAVAVGMSNGMTEPHMRSVKMFAIAATFAVFQFAMPVIGYYCGYAFSEFVGKIAPYLSFVLLAYIGGKMIFDSIKESREQDRRLAERKKLSAGKLLVQGVATSLDALAVGVTLLALDSSGSLPQAAPLCALVIGIVTFLLVLPAVSIGKKAGDKFSSGAELLGGGVLVIIGMKILLEGIL